MNTPAPAPIMVPPQPVGARRCLTCACYYTIPGPPDGQNSFCALDPPNSAAVRVEVPRLKDGQPVMIERRGQAPVAAVDGVQGFGFAHRPTQPNLVCFNGWRPLGTRPGENATAVRVRELARAAQPELTKMVEQGALPPALAALATAMLLEDPEIPPAANDETAAAPPSPGKLDS